MKKFLYIFYIYILVPINPNAIHARYQKRESAWLDYLVLSERKFADTI